MAYPNERIGMMDDFHAPPPYKDYGSPAPRRSKFDPRGWTRKTILIALGVAIVALIVLIVAIYFGVQNNSYPDYAPLTYTLQDTYSGPDFFDNFDYFTGWDPTQGFVSWTDG